MRSLPPLNPLMAFEAASRHLNFTKAARELNVTQGAISHQIAVLEDYFGARLFERKSNQLELAPNAAAYAGLLSDGGGSDRNCAARRSTNGRTSG